MSCLLELLSKGNYPRNGLLPITVHGRNVDTKKLNLRETVGCLMDEFPSFFTLPEKEIVSSSSVDERRKIFVSLALSVQQQLKNSSLDFAHLNTHEKGRDFLSNNPIGGISFNYVKKKTFFFFFYFYILYFFFRFLIQ